MSATERQRSDAERLTDSLVAVRATDRTGLLVKGGDRATWLNGLVTCELVKLGPTSAAYGLVVEKKGRIQADFVAIPASPPGDALALAVPRSLRDGLIETLDHYLIMEDAELVPAELDVWLLHGPSAAAVAAEVAAPYGGALDLLGVGGAALAFEAGDEASAERLSASVAAAGGRVLDEPSWEALRIERGLPRFGVEVDATMYPQEASLEKLAVAFDKGCYLGQEVVYMLEHRGHVKRKLVSLDLDGDEPVAAAAPITTAEGTVVGEVKSSVVGPSTGRPVAIAMVKWAQAKPGVELRVGDRVARVR